MTIRLKHVSTTAGFLEEAPVEFAAGLTCVIGARGTCKSTLIESIRYAFETSPQRAATLIGNHGGDQRAPTFGIIEATLRAGSVRCELERANSHGTAEFTVERETGGEPRIFVEGVREHTNRDLLRDIEIFSQGDLQRIAEDDNDEMRLALIDRPHRSRAAKLQEARRTTANRLRELGPELRGVRAQLSTFQHEIAHLDKSKTELQRLREQSPAASPELEAEREKFEQRQHALRSIQSLEELRSELFDNLSNVRPLARKIAESIAELQAPGGPMAVDIESSLLRLLDLATTVLETSEAVGSVELHPLIQRLDRQFEEESESYYQLRQQEQAVNEALKQQQALRRQVEHLEQQKEAADKAKAQETGLLEQREKLRGEISLIDDELYELRVKEIDEINREHGETVQLTLGSSWNTRAYAARVSGLLTGSRIRAQEEVASAIAERLEPSTLIDLVEAGDSQRLSTIMSRDLGQMTRVVAHLSDHSELYALETELPTSRLEITLYDEGQPKPVETLSKGQRATALLPIILRPLPYPLLFDQPEDDLDNSFIFRSLITTLRHLKTERQLIFVTHNANIPVLGTADRVIVMHMAGPTKAAKPLVGSVDERKEDILNLLEGGAEAFAERERYYHELLGGEAAVADGSQT